jgi:hypothetical protein
MENVLSGYKDTDYIILNKLNDYELGKVCQVNKKLKKMCDDDNFWKVRIYQKLGEYFYLKNPKDFIITTWKNYYISLMEKINSYMKGTIYLINGVPYKKDKNKQFYGVSLPGSFEEIKDEDLKIVLNKIEEDNIKYGEAIKKKNLKEIEKYLENEFIKINEPLKKLDVNDISLIEFFYEKSEKNHKIDAKILKEKLTKMANDIYLSYKEGQVSNDYLQGVYKHYPHLGKIVNDFLKRNP